MSRWPGAPNPFEVGAAPAARLAVVNGKFDTGFSPTAAQYEVIVVDR